MPVYNYDDFGKNYLNLNKAPILLHAGILINEMKWKSNEHAHRDFSEILYISQGEGCITIDEEQHFVQEGDIVVYNRNAMHLEDYSNSAATPVIYHFGIANLSIEGVEEGSILPDHVSPVISAGCYQSVIKSYCELIIDECKSHRLGYDHISSNMLSSMLILILRLVSERDDLFSNPPIATLGREIKEYIDANYKDNLSLKELSDYFHVSPFHISHSFRSEIGNSPINYLIQCRINEANRLLLGSQLSVQRISEMVGYENVSYFNLLFKKMTAQSPGKFRKEAMAARD